MRSGIGRRRRLLSFSPPVSQSENKRLTNLAFQGFFPLSHRCSIPDDHSKGMNAQMVDRLTGLEWGQLIFTVTIGPNKAMLSFLKTWTLYLLGATRVPFSRVSCQ